MKGARKMSSKNLGASTRTKRHTYNAHEQPVLLTLYCFVLQIFACCFCTILADQINEIDTKRCREIRSSKTFLATAIISSHLCKLQIHWHFPLQKYEIRCEFLSISWFGKVQYTKLRLISIHLNSLGRVEPNDSVSQPLINYYSLIQYSEKIILYIRHLKL